MRVLITGGAGFIGSHIQDKLIALGHETVVVDSLRSGKKENLNPKAAFFKIDIRDKECLDSLFKIFLPEVIFHLAAQNEVLYSMVHPLEDEDINIRGTLNLLDLAVKYHVKKFIYSNTGGAYYGDVLITDLPVEEDHKAPRPTSFYGVSKFAAELYLKLYGQIYGLSWVSLRYANVYGPRQEGNRESGVVTIFTSKLLAGQQPTIFAKGKLTRDYIYVSDVVDANIAAMRHSGNDYFNISTGIRNKTKEVFDLIEKRLKTGIKPKHVTFRAGDTLHNALSPAKAKRLLGWEPKVAFKTGINLTLDYYLDKNK